MGLGNRAASEESKPALTTVDVPVERLGREAMRLLLRMLGGEELTFEQMRIEIPVTRLVIRSSTAEVA
jgi:DNA-binding LacI/PurR family transcriptional regulator